MYGGALPLCCHCFEKGSVYVPEVVYTFLPDDFVHDSQSATDSRLYTYSVVSFSCAPKRQPLMTDAMPPNFGGVLL